MRIAALLLVCTLVLAPVSAAPLQYPPAARGDIVDNYHGTSVPDPYRWLEESDTEQTKQWISAQQAVTNAFLDTIPERARLRERLTKLWNFERYSAPFKEGGRYFYFRNDGLQNQSVLYVREALDGPPRMLIDPNTLAHDGTKAMSSWAVSRNGRYLAYSISDGGSDWQTWKVRDVDTGQDLPDTIEWTKFTGASWSIDNQGFLYSAYDPPRPGQELKGTNYYQKLFYHKLGTPQSADKLIYERKDQKEWGFGGWFSDDGAYLFVHVSQGTDPKNCIFYRDLSKPDSPFVELLNKFDAAYDFIDNDGPVFYFTTTKDAPRGRVIAIDSREPAPERWKEIIPQGPDNLDGVNCVNNTLIARYQKDAKTVVRLFDMTGQPQGEVKLPGVGSAGGFAGRRSDQETFYSFTGFTTPTTIYRYDMASRQSSIFARPKVDFNPSAYETRQVFVKSKDGTRVPMFIVHRKGIRLDGSHPTYLYGYGGFNVSILPSFSVANLVWLEMGGIYAVANLRGGGEYGEEWHLAGTRLQKQNVFDDFIAAAEWLIANKYTQSSKLAIGGGSNGGLLVGACITQRPELYGAALPAVGVLDMLRFHKFTIGWAWVSDYGSADNPDEFKALLKYSPYHNVKPGTSYPATLITTADHDDRVVPLHSFKFAAALQAGQGGPAPVLIRIDSKAGHGAGKPTSKIIDEVADRWGFLVKTLKIQLPATFGNGR